MGRLRADVERLCGEIRSLREARKRFIRELRNSAMASRGAVSEMRSNFSRNHAQMARTAKAERSAFVSRLRGTVAAERKAFAADLAGARRAW